MKLNLHTPGTGNHAAAEAIAPRNPRLVCVFCHGEPTILQVHLPGEGERTMTARELAAILREGRRVGVPVREGGAGAMPVYLSACWGGVSRGAWFWRRASVAAALAAELGVPVFGALGPMELAAATGSGLTFDRSQQVVVNGTLRSDEGAWTMFFPDGRELPLAVDAVRRLFDLPDAIEVDWETTALF